MTEHPQVVLQNRGPGETISMESIAEAEATKHWPEFSEKALPGR
jgi:hypothetical protein